MRYLARKHGMYGKDNAEATKCDILQETLQDYGGKADADEKYLCRLGRAIGAGPFFLGAGMSFVDVTFVTGTNIYGVQGVHLNPLSLFQCTFVPAIRRVLSAFLTS